jgi:flagellar basal-body rod protein FlgB
MLGGIGIFRGIMAKMNWLDQNQQVISQNIANSDTPGYRAQTLKKTDFASYLGSSGGKSNTVNITMAATNSSHFGAIDKGYTNPGEMKQKKIYEASPDDNSIVIEEQLFNANKNSTEYQIASDLYRRSTGMIRMALQGSRG